MRALRGQAGLEEMLSYGAREDHIASGCLVVERKRGYLQATVQGQLFKDIMHMALDRVRRNIDPLGDFLVAETVGNERNNFPLPFRHADSVCQLPLPFLEGMVDNMRKKRTHERKGRTFAPRATY